MLYRKLKEELFGKNIVLHKSAEEKVLLFLEQIEKI